MSEQTFNVLPQGVDNAGFAAAIDKFRAALGPDNVLTADDQLTPYMKIMLASNEANHAPSASLIARDVEQVQAVLKVCNEHKVPVWPISTGRNFGYGSAAPGHRGQVVLDLRKMDRILEVDADLCTALIEPGVTYAHLQDYITERKLPLWLDPPAPSAIASPLGNTIERGNGYGPYGEHFLFSCGMEVVLANGDVLRTGMGAIPNSNTWQVYKWGYGPYLDGLFTQSNFGIVTKLGLWLLPAPPAFKPFAVRYEDDGDIVGIVETLRPLRIAQVLPNAMVIASAGWETATLAKRADHYQGNGRTPDDVLRDITRKYNLGAWNVYGGLYGTPEQIAVNWNIVTETLKASGKGKIVTAEEVGDDPIFKYRADLMRGNMTLREFGLYSWRGGGGSMWFSPVSQARGSETSKQVEMAKKILHKYELDYVGEFVVGWRDMHHIMDVLFDRTDPEAVENAHACFGELLETFSAAGYGTYRVNTAFMDKVADIYGPVKRKVNQTIKRALDPNGIIAPGKSGIWV